METPGEGIVVKQLVKDYQYHEKEEGVSGSFKNLFRKNTKVKRAVDGISFTIPRGEMVGFIGPNGAGKTTTLKMLSGIIYPTGGDIAVNGYCPQERKKAFKKKISIVMGQKSQLWWDLPAIDSFFFNARLYEVDTQAYKRRLAAMCEMLDVEDLLHIQVRRLSLGERMKMELIAAFIHNPEVIFLDEPTIGLDMHSQQTIREFLKAYQREHCATITVTSHYIHDILDLCERSIVISEGAVVYDGSLAAINDTVQNKKLLKLKFSAEASPHDLARHGTLRQAGRHEAVLEVTREHAAETASAIFKEFPVVDFNMEDIPIEESIRALYGVKAAPKTENLA